jgi:hypothetical protein
MRNTPSTANFEVDLKMTGIGKMFGEGSEQILV